MRSAILATTFAAFGLTLFAGGFFLGRVSSSENVRTSTDEPRAVANDPAPSPDDGIRHRSRRERPNRQGDDRNAPDGERREDHDADVDPLLALAEVKAAIAAGDRHAMHESLGLLHRLPPGSMSKEELSEWIDLLREGDPRYTQDVAHALMRAGGAEAAREVLDIIRDEDLPVEMRRELLHSFGALRPEDGRKVTPLLEDFLASKPGGDLARVAAQMYGRLQGEEGFSRLLSLVTTQPELRSGPVLDALGELGGAGDADRVLGLLSKDLSQRERRSLLHAAGRLAARAGEEGMLLDLLKSPPEGLSRRELARIVGDAAQSAPLGFLEDALAATRGDRESQERIANALAHRGGKDALDRLLAAAQDPDVGLAPRTLARALAEFQGTEAVPALLDLFANTQDPDVLRPIARGIFEHGETAQVESLLEEFTNGGNRNLRHAIADSLSHADLDLGIDRYVELISAAGDGHVADRLGEALRRGHGGDFGRLNELLNTTENPRARMELLRALEDSPQPAPLAELTRGLTESKDGHVLWQYGRLLSGRGREGLAQIGSFLNNDNYGGQRHAVLQGVLDSHRMQSTEGREMILEFAAGSTSPDLRRRAIEGLADRSDASILPELSQLLARESDNKVRNALRRAIDEVSRRER